MKHKLSLTGALLLFVLSGHAQYFFANRHLSNLRTPTAVNVHLLPGSANQKNLGSAYKTWKDIYLAGNVYKGSNRFLSSDSLGNTFLGILAGTFNTGFGNTAIGHNSMFTNTAGFFNTATGYQALYNNSDGESNAAYGFESLMSNTTGFYNSAYGRGSMHNTTTGSINTANGLGALYNNTEGWVNVAIGAFALVRNTTGTGNTGIGQSALWANEINSNNTAIGNDATGNSFDYSNATFLGANTNSDSGLVNITTVGFEAYATASNQVVVGNSSVTSIGGYANWSNFSDGRYKKNIKEDVPGLAFITKLRAVTYSLDVDAIDSKKSAPIQRPNALSMASLNGKVPFPAGVFEKVKNLQSSKELKAKQEKAAIVYTGFIAQEVEQAAKSLNYDFSGVDAPKNEKSFYALRYGDFVVPLVKAVQEQQKQIDEQQKQIQELQALIQSITKQAVAAPVDLSSSTALLKQNTPNPFSDNTIISYFIPGNVSNAQIIVTDMKGSLVKTFVAAKGNGQVQIRSGELPAATYNYTLLVNGKKTESRQMIITK